MLLIGLSSNLSSYSLLLVLLGVGVTLAVLRPWSSNTTLESTPVSAQADSPVLPSSKPSSLLVPAEFPGGIITTSAPSELKVVVGDKKPSLRPTFQAPNPDTSSSETEPVTESPKETPSTYPSTEPSTQKTLDPTLPPVSIPSAQPSMNPTSTPPVQPSVQPSRRTTIQPTLSPNAPTGGCCESPSDFDFAGNPYGTFSGNMLALPSFSSVTIVIDYTASGLVADYPALSCGHQTTIVPTAVNTGRIQWIEQIEYGNEFCASGTSYDMEMVSGVWQLAGFLTNGRTRAALSIAFQCNLC